MDITYLTKVINKWNKSPFFDERENKGCTIEEINQLKKFISPYFKKIPKVIEEDLFYFGKYRYNQLGIYLLNQMETIRDQEADIENELNSGFWIFGANHFGIFSSENSFENYFNNNKVLLKDFDDPPYFMKTGDEDDNDLQITLIKEKYSLIYDYWIEDFFKRYNEYFSENSKDFMVKQCLVELYSELESVSEKMPEKLKNKYQYIAHRIRLETGRTVHGGLAIKEILYQFHEANRGKREVDTLTELKVYSTKIEVLYNHLIKSITL